MGQDVRNGKEEVAERQRHVRRGPSPQHSRSNNFLTSRFNLSFPSFLSFGSRDERSAAGSTEDSSAGDAEEDFRGRDIPGLSRAQQRKHRKWLAMLVEKNVQSWAGVRRMVEQLRTTRQWRWSTTQTAAGAIMGAVKRAVQYGLRCRVPLKQDQAWADWTREIKRNVIKEIDTLEQAKPVSAQHVDVMLRRALLNDDIDLWAFLLLMFALVSRPGCVSMLRSSQTKATPDGWLRARFLEGKGVTMRGIPYTVHSTLSPEWTTLFNQFIATKEKFIFTPASVPNIRKRALEAMRRVDKDYVHYSFRRGGALHLQSMGATIAEIRQFTGHASDAMCLRYLEWGWNNVAMAVRPRELARSMWLSPVESADLQNF